MASFQESIGDAIRNAFCALLEFEEGYLQFIEQTPLGGFAPIPLAAIRFASRWICNREPAPGISPPFRGGQCPTQYTVNYNVTYDTRSIPPPNIITEPLSITGVWGKIKGLRVDRSGGINQVVIVGGASGNPDLAVDYGAFSIAPGSGQGIISAEITSVARVDGLPDDCGNIFPTPTQPPPPPSPTPLPVPYDDADGNPINLDLFLVFAPVRVNIDGTLNIPFRISIDPDFNFQFNGNLNINTGGINFNFKNPNYPPSPSPVPDDYDTPDDIPPYPPTVPNSIAPPSPDDPEDETKDVIRACIVTVSSVSPSITVIGQDSNPDIYAPNLGYVQFGIATARAVAWTSDIPVKNLRNFIICEWEGGAIQVRGTPRNGVTWTITPVYGKADEALVFAE